MDIEVRHFDNKPERCSYALRQTEALLADETDMIAGLGNVSALLNLLLPDLNWVGFYMRRDGGLVLGPFQGRPAVSHIASGAGVGTGVSFGAAVFCTASVNIADM